jgi:K+-transporting ATPase ATPase A chain
LFVGLLVGVIIILGGLQFMPADALGPIAEHYVMNGGKTY